ncbi:uncharacterized protein LOC121377040 isoform X4 [Gigantopelta aegis]|uniref:uncharacterized protein LOC121377040 isoform X2 n=1 Tax=Gigantopelta aegis TaxID=1735272 RepID=UPI001B88C687|nr:uncharacterized protein LOC121377040 isoform X2 [Gigantopelta aegis]XP_041360820.1 uncharacterized protein LOC121377040 isoform X4 [Gigantopelta aegis]
MGYVITAVLFLVASTHTLTYSVTASPWPMPPRQDICGDTETFTATTIKQTMKSSSSLVHPSEQFSCRWVFRAFNSRLPIHLEIRPAFIPYRSYNCSLMTTVKDGNAKLRSFCEGQPGWMGWLRRISFTGYSGSMTVLLKSNFQRIGYMTGIKIRYYQDRNDPLLTTTTVRPSTTTTAWPKWIRTTWPEFITTTRPEFITTTRPEFITTTWPEFTTRDWHTTKTNCWLMTKTRARTTTTTTFRDWPRRSTTPPTFRDWPRTSTMPPTFRDWPRRSTMPPTFRDWPTSSTMPPTFRDWPRRSTMPPTDYFALCGNTSLIASEEPGYIYTPGVEDSFKSRCLWVIRPFWFGPIHLEIRSVSGYDLDCNDQQLLIRDGTKTIKRHCDGNTERYTGTEGTMRIMYSNDGFYPFTSQISIKYYQDKYYDRPDSDSRTKGPDSVNGTKDDLLLRHVATISSLTGAVVLILFVVIPISALCCRYRRNRSRRSANRTLTMAVISDGRTDTAPPAYTDLFPTEKVLPQRKDELTNDPTLPELTTSALPYKSPQTEPALVDSAKPESNI